jgi:hypothetical protein
MVRVTIAMGLTVLLSACGGGSSSSTSTSSTTTTTSKDAAVPASVAALAGGVEGSNDCSKNPDFLPIYPGGTIRICSNAHFDATHKTSGMVGYGTSAAPDVVLAWAREQVVKNGLPVRISSDKMLSAGQTNGRTIMTMAFPEGSGSKVTVNWSNPD